jgi:hypothetical protein
MPPDFTISTAFRKCCPERCMLPPWKTTPLSFTAWSMACASAMVVLRGFSQ